MQHALVFAALVVAGCGSDASTAGDFDDELASFRTALCSAAAQCDGEDQASCEADVTSDMAQAKAELDAAGQQRCASCMHAKTIEFQKVLVGCDESAADTDAILAACDLDPNDGVDHTDEACAGFP